MYIFGAGRHAEEIFFLMEDIKIHESVEGFVVDDPGYEKTFLKKPKISFQEFLINFSNKGEKPKVFVAIGDIQVNKRITINLINHGFSFERVINKEIKVDRQKYLGSGITIAQGTRLTTNVIVNDFTIINIGCNISHDVTIGRHVNICPGVNIAGNVIVEDEVFIGTGATIIPKIKIGKGCVIAAGACVTKDCPEYSLIAGIPAQVKKQLF